MSSTLRLAALMLCICLYSNYCSACVSNEVALSKHRHELRPEAGVPALIILQVRGCAIARERNYTIIIINWRPPASSYYASLKLNCEYYIPLLGVIIMPGSYKRPLYG